MWLETMSNGWFAVIVGVFVFSILYRSRRIFPWFACIFLAGLSVWLFVRWGQEVPGVVLQIMKGQIHEATEPMTDWIKRLNGPHPAQTTPPTSILTPKFYLAVIAGTAGLIRVIIEFIEDKGVPFYHYLFKDRYDS